MRKFPRVDEYDLMGLIRILTDNGCRLEIHRTQGEDEYYDVFILGGHEDDNL